MLSCSFRSLETPMPKSSFVALLVFLFSAASIAGDCADVKGNLIANCGFDGKLDGWTAFPGATISIVSDSAGESVLMAEADSNASLGFLSSCLRASPSTPYTIAARVRLRKGEAYFCGVNAWQYSDANCGEGAEPLGSAAMPPESEWKTVTTSVTALESTRSIQLHPVCSGPAGFIMDFDDFVLRAE